ncbi:MATE family efflux transporter [Marinisporobacter balticus]|uniref:Multidrug export protein MepA n=1 Tax=Marinisporobacter balticus TaxID=2018667 RepID=A0A4R2KNV9_9FIRM|nr:MATE family efflux transporter [Marinisporobacter balticus]TCO75194.1 putative MATE family efflux protein [Marinisporobacter balticus]
MKETEQIDSEQSINPLAQKFNIKLLLQFAFPTIFMMVFMGLYTIVDTIFVARLVNTNALSAINIVCPVINIIVGLGTMLATGGNAIISRKMGNNNEQEVHEDFSLIILTGLTIGVLIAILGLLYIESIIKVLGASDLLFPYCKDYLKILLIFTPASILQVLFQNLFVTAGKPSLGFWLVVFAGCTNALFDYVFIAILKMGIAGAALATSMGYMIPTVAGCIFFLQNKGGLHLCKPKMRLSILCESCFNGSSEMVSQLATAVTTFLFNATMLKLLGEDGVAAITIIIYSQFLLTTLYIGFSMGVAPIIGYNYGSRNINQLRSVFQLCIGFVFTVSILVFLISFLGGEYIVRTFAKDSDTVYSIAQNGFAIFAFSFLFSGLNIFACAMFTALSNGKISAILSFLRTFGFITIGLIVLPKILNINGIWLAIPVAEFLTFLLSATVLVIYKKQYRYI